MKQHLFFDEAIGLVKTIWVLIALSGALIIVSLSVCPAVWIGAIFGILLGVVALVIFGCKADLIRRDSYAIMPRPFKTSSILCFLVAIILSLCLDHGVYNPFSVGLFISGFFFMVAKIIEPEYY